MANSSVQPGLASQASASRSPSSSPRSSKPTADFLYETFYGGAIGGVVLALFFLVVDAVARQPLFTPSLVATVIFTDTPATAATEIRLDMVAYFSILHFATFLVAGASLSGLYRVLAPYARRSTFLVALTFALLTGGFALIGITVAPGVVPVIGLAWIVLGNLLTAFAMVAFLDRAYASSEEAEAETHG
jgi:hypothetical protein